MVNRNTKDLKQLLHPYIFVLKEGQEIKDDLLDYSLMMLQVTCPEVIKSPSAPTKQQISAATAEIDVLKASLVDALMKKQNFSQ